MDIPQLVQVADSAQASLHFSHILCCPCRSTTPSKGNVAVVGKATAHYYHQKQMAILTVLYARYLYPFNK